ATPEKDINAQDDQNDDTVISEATPEKDINAQNDQNDDTVIDPQSDEKDKNAQNNDTDTDSQDDETDINAQNDEMDINVQNDEKIKNIQNDKVNISETNANTNIEDLSIQESSKSVKRNWSIKRVFSVRKKKNKNNQSNDIIKVFKDDASVNQSHDIVTEQDDHHVIPPEPLIENMTTTYFHVIMPKKVFKKKLEVFVIGNIDKLGDTRYGIVRLNRHENNPIYWYSDPINIPINVIEDKPFKYSYFVYKGNKSSLAKKLFNQFTSKSSSDEVIVPDIHADPSNWCWDNNKREFIFRENQYDIWDNNEKFQIRPKDILKNYPYISVIYESINEKNLKEKIIEYLGIRKAHAHVLDYDMLEQFIFKNFNDSNPIKQNVFLCVLLGYVINEKMFKSHMPLGYNLPEIFPSIDMLQTFKNINKDDLPHEVIEMLPQVVCAVVLHISTYSTKFEWIKAFEVAPIIDPKYTFLDQFKTPVCTRENESKFLESINKFVKPCMDEITNDNIYVKVCKNLISLCQSIGAIIFLWQTIFHSDSNISEDLCEYSLDRLTYFMLNDNAKELEKHLKEIPVNFSNIDFAPIFRQRIFKLLTSLNVNWGKDNVESILKLLNSNRLDWQENSILQALNYISASKNMELLQSFPNQLVTFLDEGFKNINLKDKQLSEICTQWFKSTLKYSSKDIEENFACTIFDYLSIMCSIMKKYDITCNRLFNAAEEAVKVLKDNVIFDAAADIGDLNQNELIEIFSSVLKERFDCNQNSDTNLLDKILRICKSNGQQLHIPNKLCEDIVFHILTKLQPNLSNIEMNIIEDNFHMILLASSTTGSVEELNSRHIYVQTVRRAINQLAKKLLDKSIEINMLKNILLGYDDNQLLAYFSTIYEISELKINKKVLQDLRKSYESYMDKLKKLDIFYNRFCIKATDKQDYILDIERKLNMQEIVILENITKKLFWKFHYSIIEIAQRSYIYIESQTFKNVFEKYLESNEETLTVELIALRYIHASLLDYDNLRAEYKDWTKLECSKISSFWKGIDVNNINYELELMSRGMKWQPKDKLKKAVSYLAHIKSWRERLDDLGKTLKNFRVPDVADSWVTNVYNRLLKESLTLLELYNAFNEANKHIHNLDDNCWAMIGALSFAGDFISWLQTIAEGDLRNLINGVDDKREVQDETVASLIEVKQFLAPLIKYMVKLFKEGKSTLTVINKFLDHICKITSKNESLHEKITQCCSSSLALQNIYFSILNRGEVTKERIKDAATRGSYKFYRDENHDKCMVELVCKDKSGTENSYDLFGLQDLQGQALLIAKQAASAFVLRLPVEKGSSLEQGTDDLMKFVQQVDTVHQIIKYSSQLMELGHFSYRKWNITINSTENMISLLENLKQDLDKWKKIMEQAQNEYYCLTFYTAKQILAFYDYFSCNGTVDSKTLETCKTLLKFVSKGAELPPNKGDITIDIYQTNFKDVLWKIGEKLETIFKRRSEYPRLIRARLEPIMSDVVYSGKLFVAACTDTYRVPNIILSLYANHLCKSCHLYPEPWQLLMCRATTTAEEISLFIKRCFLASKKGYKDYLFCIAGLEFLDFELQYMLVNDIRYYQETENDYYIALICCRENGVHHHILDQFSERVCPTNGLGEYTMTNMYKELCPNVFCVTSDLSGQGKSEYIKNASFEKDLIIRSLLISDNIRFDELVRKLSECKLRSIESMHLNIVSADSPIDVNVFLFELLTFGFVSNKMEIVCLPKCIFIEVASTDNDRLLNSIPIAKYLNRVNIKWNINNLAVSREFSSPIQIVSQYLDTYDRNELNEKDIPFTGLRRVNKTIEPNRCHQLVQKYFLNDNDESITSYRFIEIFLKVLADQLIRLSSSSYFTVDNLKLMVGDKDIRTTLMKTLLEVSKDFATRSIATKAAQLESTLNVDNDQLEKIVQWDASNHLLVFFLSQTPDSICALYRNRDNVPDNVKQLLLSQEISNYQVDPSQPEEQKIWELDNYHTMSSSSLLEKLERIARNSMGELKLPNYALSADNLLKMALILLRARANIPVVICGEAGCGKTSLIGFLAAVVEVKFRVLSLHAGIQENQIHKFMVTSTKYAKDGQVWLFFDEINTCNHIGLLADLIAHRTLSGRPIHWNIRLFAACNPYRLRKKSASSVGLEKNYQEQSQLVYQVHPLPNQILDYVWDYGILKPEDEKEYIKIMVESQIGSYPLFVDLLCESQEFIRSVEEPYTVSLRDVKRAIKLAKWFQKSLKERPPAMRTNSISLLLKHWSYPPKDNKKLMRCSFVLSLGLCYQSRLYDQDLRKRYRERMSRIFKEHRDKLSASDFQMIIRKEQEDFMQRMVIPPSTADNEALLENILVMIVCILNRIPVFIIGSPGSSKSLAIRIISSNLRGADSEDEYFKTLPQVYFIPHQGSASSTSAGIVKVFDKAKNYQKTSSEAYPVQAVVLLDEVGLAETSRFNPLKVLHALLEPGFSREDSIESPEVSVVDKSKEKSKESSKEKSKESSKENSNEKLYENSNEELNENSKDLIICEDILIDSDDEAIVSLKSDDWIDIDEDEIIVSDIKNDNSLISNGRKKDIIEKPSGSGSKKEFNDDPAVSVVGISNWRLDNSKSSRALLVQRPKFGVEDLFLTASMLLDGKTKNEITDSRLRQLADAYLDYEKNQKYKNFHGLRDYYSLVKSLSDSDPTMSTLKQLELGLIRNFGGTDQTKLICENYFGKVLNSFSSNKNYIYTPIPIEKLINENLNRKDTRHLMVIGKSDSLVDLLTYHVRNQQLDPVVLCGSQFPDDGDGDYLYAVLSRIMMCVEAGRPLILTDLDIIYGSLYDLWNQNYITLGSRKDTKYFTRVALGAYSNPMLYVHPDFKCILVMDESKLEYTDPPLLNRFEKQRLTLNDILSEHHNELCDVLVKWVRQISTVQGVAANEFTEKDIFIGFNKEETIQSLVFDQCRMEEKNGNDELTLERCKERLIAIASSDGIVRAKQSLLFKLKPQEVNELYESYFNDGLHDDIESCLRTLLGDKKNRKKEAQLIIVNTFSNINTDIKACLGTLEITCQIDKLSTFKTEAQLQDRIKHFWLDSNDELLVLQCDQTMINSSCIKLAKFIIEQIRTKYLEKKRKNDNDVPVKHVCILLHIHREQRTASYFDFMCGWNQITVGTLTPEEKNLPVFLNGKITNVMNSVLPFEEILEQELLWCLLCIRYPSTMDSLEHIKYLVNEIPKYPRIVKAMKQKTLEWLDEDMNTLGEWQLKVATNKRVLYLHSSFCTALQAYIRISVRKNIAKQLCVLERLSALKTLINLECKNGDNYLIEFWYQMFDNNKVIDIEFLMDPKPDIYPMESGPYTLDFPFSYYLFKQINLYEKLYLEDIKILKEDKNNIDNYTGDLLDNVLADCFERFQSILSKIPALEGAPSHIASHLYYKDFLTFISSNHGGSENFKLINLLLLRPKDINDGFENFEKDLPDIAARLTLDRIHNIRNEQQFDQWQLEASQILILCSELSTGPLSLSLQLLNICNDLVSKQVIPFDRLSTVVNIGLNGLSDSRFIDHIFRFFDSNTHPNTIASIARQNFVQRILDIIPLESPTRLHFYEKLFEQAQPLPFTAFIVLCIFRSEEQDQFTAIIRNTNEVLHSSPRLNIINTQLEKNSCNSQLAALCCDVIQKEFFAKLEFGRLQQLFRDALQALCSKYVKPLQIICAIALLKKFVSSFWSSLARGNALNEPIKFNSIDSNRFMIEMNELMQTQHPQVQSLKYYFLKRLRSRGLSMNDLKQFCNLQKDNLPWLTDLPWNKDNDSRLPFNPYILFNEYDDADDSLNGRAQLNSFLKKLSSANNVNLRIAFVGVIVNRLYSINAMRSLNANENEMVANLKVFLDTINLSPVYKQLIMRLLNDDHSIFQIRPNIDNKNLLICLVIIHILAVHASLPFNHSPLTLYLHRLQDAQNTYILTCPSDEEAILMGAITGVAWYSCDCGYKYVVTECGQTMQNWDCPKCGKTIGGQHHKAAAGQTRLDQTQVQNTINNSDKTGYIMETGSLEQYKSVREMTSPSYRILHIFIHAIISASASKTGSTEIILSGNESELLSALELLLCFIKRTASSDGNITLKSYIQQWVKLSVLTENKALEKVLNTGLRLKHVIALYEIIEGKIADIMIESITVKYKASLTKEIEEEILESCSFDMASEKQKIAKQSNIFKEDGK
ncbi:30956_t:CDS:10, partial [Gigaspora margarita]